MGYFECYLIVINIVGFVLFAVNTWLYKNTRNGQVDNLLTVTCLVGGSVGILLSMFLIDRKAVKANMMSRVFIACVLVIQIVVLLVIRGHVESELTFAIVDFFSRHRLFVIYLVVINFVTLCACAGDKIAAIEQKQRTRNVTLLGLAFIGGAVCRCDESDVCLSAQDKERLLCGWRSVDYADAGGRYCLCHECNVVVVCIEAVSDIWGRLPSYRNN